MPLVLLLILILILIVLGWITANVLGVIITLIIAGLIGGLAEAVVPGRAPYGWIGAIAAGLLGSWLGTLLIGHVGPVLAGIPLIPAFAGAIIIVAIVELLFRSRYRGREP
ncbi:MAG TPA: GlsB/YeaQ/YmgE family stress response membrane protein [Chloroflexota bacterium]|nr:GlsB/YeaQ/YmgE family stress response membrane protein [Chloroflexota bacterium]